MQSRIIGNNAAVLRASQVISSHSIAQQNALVRRGQRAASFFTVPPAPVEEQPEVTSLGLEVTRTFTILEAQLTEDVALYELREGDKVLDDRGVGTVTDDLPNN
jgi:hypothetical protein